MVDVGEMLSRGTAEELDNYMIVDAPLTDLPKEIVAVLLTGLTNVADNENRSLQIVLDALHVLRELRRTAVGRTVPTYNGLVCRM